MKYQSSSQCLKVSSKVKFTDRFTEWQKDGMTEWQTTVNIDSCRKPQAYPLKVFRKYDKNNTFILVNMLH